MTRANMFPCQLTTSGRVQKPGDRGSGNLISLATVMYVTITAARSDQMISPTIRNRDSGNLVNPFMRVTN
jgi:hypothetical protein